VPSRDENIFAPVPKNIYRTGYQPIEETKIKTQIALRDCSPVYIRVTQTCFPVPCIWASRSIFTCGSHMRLSPIVPLCPVKPTTVCSCLSDCIIRGSQLQVIQELNVPHRPFGVDIPAQSTGRKEPKPVAFPNFLGSFVRAFILQYVPLVVVVCT